MDKWCLAVIYQRALHSFSHFELRLGGAPYFPAEADIMIREIREISVLFDGLEH